MTWQHHRQIIANLHDKEAKDIHKLLDHQKPYFSHWMITLKINIGSELMTLQKYPWIGKCSKQPQKVTEKP